MPLLDYFFNDKPENLYVLLWRLRGKQSHWVKTKGQAQAIIEENNKDIYVGAGYSRKDYGATRRCPAQEIAGVRGLWVDVDIRGPAHQKTNLPENQAEAQEFLETIIPELPPTLIIHSGNGLQGWWMFVEPWVFDTPQERIEAAQLAQNFSDTLRAKGAAKNGWDLDATHDLSRVMRPPGTLNCKREPKEVNVLFHDLNRLYNPSEFDPYLIDGEYRPTMPTSGNFTLNSHASPDFDKFEILKEIEPNFIKSWERNRGDMQDKSPSAYDLSLANYSAMAGWTDQEIVDLLIAHRRKHGDDLKLREDYYARTVARARQAAQKLQAQEFIDELTIEDNPGDNQPLDKQLAKRKATLKHLSSLFGVEVVQIIKYLADPPTYELVTLQGSIHLGDVSNLIGQAKLRNAIAAATGKYIAKVKSERWDCIAQALLDVCEEQGVGKEATDQGMVSGWLTDYLDEKPPIGELEEAARTRNPYKESGKVYIFGGDLRRWLNITRGEKITVKQMGRVLRKFGCEPTALNVTFTDLDDGSTQRTTRNVWQIPQELNP